MGNALTHPLLDGAFHCSSLISNQIKYLLKFLILVSFRKKEEKIKSHDKATSTSTLGNLLVSIGFALFVGFSICMEMITAGCWFSSLA